MCVFLWQTTKGPLAKVVQFGCEQNMRFQIKNDPSLAEKLIPSYDLGCKRVLFTNEYLPIFVEGNDPRAELVTDPVEEITETGIKTKHGHFDLDVIVYATGFDIEESICGFEAFGQSDGITASSLRERFDLIPAAHKGVTVPGFPNFYILLGPNTVLTHNSVIFMIECQVHTQ